MSEEQPNLGGESDRAVRGERALTVAQSRLVADHLWIPRDAAKHFRSKRVEREELEQCGRLALVEAALHHPTAAGGSFRAYAWVTVTNAMLALLGREAALADRTHAIMVVCLGLSDEPMKPFSEKEVDKREALESLAARAITARIAGFTRYAEQVDPTGDPEILLARAQLGRALDDALEALPPELSAAIRRYYLEGLSLKQICDGSDEPYIKIRRRNKTALDALRAGLSERGYGERSE